MNKIIITFNNIIIQLAKNNSISIPDFLNNTKDGKMDEDLDFINDLHFDSLLLIAMVVEIESTFGIEIPDSALAYDTLRSYKSLCDVILYLCKGENNDEKIK